MKGKRAEESRAGVRDNSERYSAEDGNGMRVTVLNELLDNGIKRMAEENEEEK